MKSYIQEKISPPKVTSPMKISDAPTKASPEVLDSTGPREQVDFRSLMSNSNLEMDKEREAQKNGDFTKARTIDDYHKLIDEKNAKEISQRVPKNNLDKDDFLKLFVTQLQNQDPLQPKDHSDMAAQLAHFNSLEQMLNVNKTLETMNGEQLKSRALDLLGYVGKEVSVEGGRLRLTEGKIADTSFAVTKPVATAVLEVRDDTGKVVSEQPLGSLEPGQHKLDFEPLDVNGEKLPDGLYTFTLKATTQDGKDLPIDFSSKLKITGVDITEGGSFYTDMGKLHINDVKSVGSPGYTKAAENNIDQLIKSKVEEARGQAGGRALDSGPQVAQNRSDAVAGATKAPAPKKAASSPAAPNPAAVPEENPVTDHVGFDLTSRDPFEPASPLPRWDAEDL